MALTNYKDFTEQIGDEDNVLMTILSKIHTDGLSFYRAVARHVLGDPSLYRSIFDAVLTHYLRVIADDKNPYHDQYKQFDRLDVAPFNTFVGGLSCPDVCVGPHSSVDTASSILEVITNALEIKLVIYRHDMTLWLENGPVRYPEYHVKFLSSEQDKMDCHCSSLTPANDGKALIDYLERQQDDTLPVKKIIWWREPGEDGKYHCYNEYNPETAIPDLSKNPDSLSVFTVFVKKSSQIIPALKLMDEALRRAPGQEIPLSQRQKHTPMKRYIAVDAEFKEVTIDENSALKKHGQTTNETRAHLRAGLKEQLCSVLTIAVDRHLVFSFYLLDMLQNPESDTVANISVLFRGLILNKEYLKIWFNFQNDIAVLDATIAHMYQGTLRNDFEERKRWDHPAKRWVRPSWKIDSGKYFKGERPADLVFPRRSLCDLHDDVPGDNVNNHGHCCPCVRTGNVDITTIMDHLCLQFNYRNPIWGMSLKRRTWVSARQYCSYERFVTWTMGADRLFPLLNYFKSIPDSFGGRGDAARNEFYQSLGPGMEGNDHLMGYNIGDVAGVALLMRFLTTTDDRMLFVAGLANYSFNVTEKSSNRAIEQHPHQINALEPPQSMFPKPYIYLNDYAKKWRRERVGKELLYYKDNAITKLVTVADVFRGDPELAGRVMPYFEHEARARIGRECFNALKQVSEQLGLSYEKASYIAKKGAHIQLFDPLDYTFPDWFASAATAPIRPRKGRVPIIRSGNTPYEDYLAMWGEKHSSPTAGFPRGFTASRGLLSNIMRPMEIANSHLRLRENPQFQPQHRPLSPLPPSNPCPIDMGLRSEALLPSEQRTRLQAARREAQEYLFQKRIDDEGDRMAEIRLDDIFDPYGRKYRRYWNRAVDGDLNYEEKVVGEPPPSPFPISYPSGAAIGSDEDDARAQQPYLIPVGPEEEEDSDNVVMQDSDDSGGFDWDASHHSGDENRDGAREDSGPGDEQW